MEIEAPEAAGKGGRTSGGAREDITKNYTPDMLVKLQNGFHIDLILQVRPLLICWNGLPKSPYIGVVVHPHVWA